MKMLYTPLNRKETLLGWCFAAVYLIGCFVLSHMGINRFYLLAIAALAGFLAAVLLFPRFWKETWKGLSYTGKQLLWKPLLAAVFAKVVCVVFNDIALLYGLAYFTASDWGPVLWDVRGAVLELVSNSAILPAITVILLIPVVEEFIFRGVIFGSFYSRSPVLAVILSTVLYAAFRTLLFTGVFHDPTYLCLYFLQHIPMALLACWLYTTVDSIAAPIAVHMFYDAMLIISVY